MSRIPVARPQSQQVIAQARRNARLQEEFIRGGFNFVAIKDHILPSLCNHPKDQGDGNVSCSRCAFAALALPELPEMVFPHNKFSVAFTDHPDSYIEFNAFDALLQVISDKLPDVAPSAIWQSTRKGIGENHSHPFDWTYTTDYCGTVKNCLVEPTEEIIDLERLKQQDEIGFYSQITLYEDELADHGCAELTARVRVMPNFFFALMRFYLRIDHVLIRVCDTRLVGDNNSGYIIREWSRREAKVQNLKHLTPDILHDSNRVWSHLPVVRSQLERISPNV